MKVQTKTVKNFVLSRMVKISCINAVLWSVVIEIHDNYGLLLSVDHKTDAIEWHYILQYFTTSWP